MRAQPGFAPPPEDLGAVASVLAEPTAATLPLHKLAPEAALRRLELTVVRRLEGFLHGDHQGLLPGPGSEANDARAYVPGQDDVRKIDWAVTARTTCLLYTSGRDNERHAESGGAARGGQVGRRDLLHRGQEGAVEIGGDQPRSSHSLEFGVGEPGPEGEPDAGDGDPDAGDGDADDGDGDPDCGDGEPDCGDADALSGTGGGGLT